MHLHRKLALAGILIAGLAVSAVAQDPAALEDNYQAKLKKDFMKHIAWEQSYDAALAKAEKSNMPVLAYFTRSYAP